MPKVTLREAFIYAGKVYGPGEAEVSDEVKKALAEKGAFDKDRPTTQERAERAARAAAVVVDEQGQ